MSCKLQYMDTDKLRTLDAGLVAIKLVAIFITRDMAQLCRA